MSENNKVIQKNVIKVNDTTVTYEDGKTQKFDYLLCCTGAQSLSCADFGGEIKTKEQVKEFFSESGKKIKNAKNILVVGGGAVGIEFAGEIVSTYGKEKNVTLATSSEQLFNGHIPPMKPKFKKNLAKKVKNRGINVVFNAEIKSKTLFNNGNNKFIYIL